MATLLTINPAAPATALPPVVLADACDQVEDETLFPAERDYCTSCDCQLEEAQTGRCDDCLSFAPTVDQLATLEDFKTRFNAATCKKQGYRDWKEALVVAWHQGWDDRCEGGHHLRQLRNTAGSYEWLQDQPIS